MDIYIYIYIYRGDEKDNLGEHTLQDERDALICDMPEINMVCSNILYFLQIIPIIIIIIICTKCLLIFDFSPRQHIQGEIQLHLKNGLIILMQKVDYELLKGLYLGSSSVAVYIQTFELKHGNFY